MMRPITWLACVLFVAGTPLAHAASDTSKAAAVESKTAGTSAGQQTEAKAQSKWESMTPEQKAQAKKRARSNWEAMTPEQKAEAKKRRSERRNEMERAATKETAAKESKEKMAAKPAAELPPPSAGPR